MTLDEKLDQFYAAAIDSATSQNIQIVEEYKNTLQNMFNDHKEEVLKKTEATFREETNNLIREKNRKLSSDAINIKRKISEKSTELTDKLFEEVEEKLNSFMKTSDYEALLSDQIVAAIHFARGDEVTLYINPSDESLKASLEMKTGVVLTISATDFVGGTRAVIHSKNILIDNSFSLKFEESKNAFMF